MEMTQLFSILCLLSILALAHSRNPRIVGGNYAGEKQFPYQISLQVRGSQICGGGLIGKRFVLTAAHCVTNDNGQFSEMSGYTVVINRAYLNDVGKGQSFKVVKIYIPSSYQSREIPTGGHIVFNDIAILKLNRILGNKYSKLELPIKDKTYAGQFAKLAGYGWNSVTVHTDQFGKPTEIPGRQDRKLKYLDVKIMSENECKRFYQHAQDSNICALAAQQSTYGSKAGACRGDSGGPLVIAGTVIGVVSVSPFGCDNTQQPAMYTRVSSYLPFINNVMKGIETADMRIQKVSETGNGVWPQRPGFSQYPGFTPQQVFQIPQELQQTPGYPYQEQILGFPDSIQQQLLLQQLGYPYQQMF